jgi:hypothetical protein
MEPLYDLHAWSEHYREEALREAQQRHLLQRERPNGERMSIRSTFRLASAAALTVVTMALLLTLAGAKPAEAEFAEFPEGHGPIAFENDGDIWVVSLMHLENLTPNTTDSNEVDPSVSPDGRNVAFASDRDGDFEIYTANVFTREVERLTDHTVYDYNPDWSLDGERITYIEPLLSPEYMRIFGLRITHEEPLPSRE